MAAAARPGAGRTGAVLAFLFYGLILSLLKHPDTNLSMKLVDNVHIENFTPTVMKLTKQRTNKQTIPH